VLLPELADSTETMTNRFSNREMVGVATTVVPAVGRPELPELRATMKPVPVDADDICRRVVCERRSSQLSDGLELLGWAPTEDVDASAAPVSRVGELVRQPVGVATRIPENDVLGNLVDHRLAFRDDDEFGFGVATLNLASGSDVVADVSRFVDVADDADLWLVLEEAINEPLQIGIPEVVVEHSDREAEVLILGLLIPTVLPKAGKEAEGQRVGGEWNSMEERHVICLSGFGNLASSTGVSTQIGRHGWDREAAAGRPAPFQGHEKRELHSINQQPVNLLAGVG